MSPSSPESAISLSFATPGWYSSRWPTISVRPVSRGRGDRALGVGDRLRERLLDEAVLAGAQHALGERGVASAPGVASTTASSSGSASRSSRSPVKRALGNARRAALARLLGGVAAPGQLAARQGGEVARQVRAPVAEARDAESDRSPPAILERGLHDALARPAVAVERRALGRRLALQRGAARRRRRGRPARSSPRRPSRSTRWWRAA